MSIKLCSNISTVYPDLQSEGPHIFYCKFANLQIYYLDDIAAGWRFDHAYI